MDSWRTRGDTHIVEINMLSRSTPKVSPSEGTPEDEAVPETGNAMATNASLQRGPGAEHKSATPQDR